MVLKSTKFIRFAKYRFPPDLSIAAALKASFSNGEIRFASKETEE